MPGQVNKTPPNYKSYKIQGRAVMRGKKKIMEKESQPQWLSNAG